MKGDIWCIPEDMHEPGFNFEELMGIEEELFPLYALQVTNRLKNGTLEVYSPRNRHLFTWSMPHNADEYVHIVEVGYAN